MLFATARNRTTLVCVIAALIGASCSRRGELAPVAAGTALPPGPPAENGGVRLAANPRAWNGSVAVREQLAPVELSLRNDSGRAVHFALADVTLASARGELRALAPDSIRVRPLRTTVGLDPSVPDDFGSLPLRAERSRELELGEEVRAAALRDRWIADRRSARGFVYFERPPRSADAVALVVVLRDRPGGSPVARVGVPFRVE